MPEFRCPECGYVFSEEKGDEHEGYPPGTTFESLPDDFVCPDCAVRYKEDFEIAGAAAAANGSTEGRG